MVDKRVSQENRICRCYYLTKLATCDSIILDNHHPDVIDSEMRPDLASCQELRTSASPE